MRSVLNDLKIPLLSLLLTGLMAAFFLPPMPIDETRYLSVAWEMQHAGSYIVPLQNGEPYAHKPPFLFWMLQTGWKLFGVNDVTPRLTICLFGMLSILLLHKVSLRLWPEEKKTAACAALVLGSTVIWTLWSCAIMFDVMITFWVLISILGMLTADTAPKKGWILLTLGITGGMLTKGPVIMVYTLPLVLLRPLWSSDRSVQWKLLTAFLAGTGLALLWAIPAAIQGGAEYRHDIFWGQTVNRLESSFAHRRPFWWYIPILPALFFPWLYFQPALAKIKLKQADSGTRLSILWLAVPFIIFSMISGKQVHYLVPILPAGALLLGRNIARSGNLTGTASVKIIGALYLLLGVVALVLPFVHLSEKIGQLDAGSTWIASAGLLSIGLLLILFPFRSTDSVAKGLALCTVLVLLFGLFEANKSFMDSYNLKGMAVAIKGKMDEGCDVAHMGKYYGQYQFLGRLPRPLTLISGKDSDEVRQFIADHPNGVLISYLKKKDQLPENSIIYYKQRYRGESSIVLWGPQLH